LKQIQHAFKLLDLIFLLQTQGLGTALKILFSGKELASNSEPSFYLLRQEVVSLINAFAK